MIYSDSCCWTPWSFETSSMSWVRGLISLGEMGMGSEAALGLVIGLVGTAGVLAPLTIGVKPLLGESTGVRPGLRFFSIG
jgi:hypothetical protein